LGSKKLSAKLQEKKGIRPKKDWTEVFGDQSGKKKGEDPKKQETRDKWKKDVTGSGRGGSWPGGRSKKKCEWHVKPWSTRARRVSAMKSTRGGGGDREKA